MTGDIDKGLFVIEGKLGQGIDFSQAEKEVFEVLKTIENEGLEEKELLKVKNKSITSNLFAKTSVLNPKKFKCSAENIFWTATILF